MNITITNGVNSYTIESDNIINGQTYGQITNRYKRNSLYTRLDSVNTDQLFILDKNQHNQIIHKINVSTDTIDVDGTTSWATAADLDAALEPIFFLTSSGGGVAPAVTKHVEVITAPADWTFDGSRYYIDAVHGLGTKDLLIEAYDISTDDTYVFDDYERTDANTVRIWSTVDTVSANVSISTGGSAVLTGDLGGAVSPENYGAIGNGITDDTSAFKLAITAAGNNGSITLKSGSTYLIKNELLGLNGQKFLGHNSTLKRGDAEVTTTTAVVGTADTDLDVVDGSVFEIGDYVILLDVTSPNSGTAYGEESATRRQITNIVGNTITVDGTFALPTNGNLPTEYPIGTKVLKVYHLISFLGANNENIVFDGVSVDGNKANNTEYLGWNHNGSIDNLGTNSIVKNGRFENIPNENIFIDDHCVIRDNYAKDLNGSFVHVSKESEPTSEGYNKIVNNNMINICIIDLAINGHNEGAVTCSNRTIRTLVDGNSLETCGGGLISNFALGVSEADDIAIITNNICKGIKGVCDGSISSTGFLRGFNISNNYFEDYDYLYFSTQVSYTLPKGGGFDDIRITGNTFINGRFLLESCSNVLINGNTFICKDGYSPANTKIPTGDLDYANQLTFNLCVDVTVSDNKFVNEASTQSVDLKNWVMLDLSANTFIKSDAITNTLYWYGGRNFMISNNTVEGFGFGLKQNDNVGTGTKGDHSYVNCQVKGNSIVMRKDASSEIALEIVPGMIADGNKIYGDSNASQGIFVYPCNTSVAASLNGGMAFRNYIIGITQSIRVGRSTGLEPVENSYVEYNEVDGAISDQTSGASTIANNITLDAAETILLDLPRENSGFY